MRSHSPPVTRTIRFARQSDWAASNRSRSIFPSVQNLLLAARSEGLGTALTTLLCAREAEVKALLAIPDGIATAALIPLGWPAKGFPKKLARRPLEDIAFGDEWNAPVFV